MGCRRFLAGCAAGVLAGCSGEEGPVSPAAGPELQYQILSGDQQTGLEGLDLPLPYRVRLTLNGMPQPGREVSWSVTAGGGTVQGSGTTDPNGVATAVHRLGSPGGQAVMLERVGAAVAVTLHATAVANRRPVLVKSVPIPPNYGMHDTFVRDGIAFACAWNTGVIIYDVGNGVRGGSPANPVEIGRLVTATNGVPGGAAVHNAWWFHNPVTQERRYLFIGQEGPGLVGASSSGDIHVVDVSDLANPTEVAFFTLAGSGTHNFWMDEDRQILYAAYYDGGVVALDVSGQLEGNLASRLRANTRPGGPGNTYVWGVQLAGGALWATDILSGFWKLDPATLEPLAGGNNVPDRFGSDLWVTGPYAYTGTWGTTPRNGAFGDVVKVWQVSGSAPFLLDSIKIADIHTVSDLQATDDAKLLVVTAEREGASGLYVYSLADPAHPQIAGFYPVPSGLHTGTVARIAGRQLVFAAKNPDDSGAALLIFDVTGLIP